MPIERIAIGRSDSISAALDLAMEAGRRFRSKNIHKKDTTDKIAIEKKSNARSDQKNAAIMTLNIILVQTEYFKYSDAGIVKSAL